MNLTTLEWIAARAFERADGEGSMPITSTFARVAAQALENELGDRAGAAPEIHDLSSAGPMTRFHDPPVDFGEERMAGEGLERKTLIVCLAVNRDIPPPRSESLNIHGRGRVRPGSLLVWQSK